MPILYHGARRLDALGMAGTPGTIDVARGGGEFGRGFYCHQSLARAQTWILNRISEPAVLELDVPEREYEALDVHYKTVKQARRLTQWIRAHHQQNTYLDGCDVIEGPLNLNRHRIQYKFESAAAQTLLNGPLTGRQVI